MPMFPHQIQLNENELITGVPLPNSLIGSGVVNSTDHILKNIGFVARGISGFASGVNQNRAFTTLSFTNNIFTISAVYPYDYFVNGIKFTRSTSASITITTPVNYSTLNPSALGETFSGLCYVYFDTDGSLQYKLNCKYTSTDVQLTSKQFYDSVKDKCLIALLKLVKLNNIVTPTIEHYLMFDKRYGVLANKENRNIWGFTPTNMLSIPDITNALSFGTSISGTSIGSYGVYFTFSYGGITDGDITSVLGVNSTYEPISIFSLEGNTVTVNTRDSCPLLTKYNCTGPTFTTGIDLPAIDKRLDDLNGSRFIVTEVENNTYFNMHYFVVNNVKPNVVESIIGFSGHNCYFTPQEALLARRSELLTIKNNPILANPAIVARVQDNLPIEDMQPLFSILFHASTAYSSGMVKIIRDDKGCDYTDLRNKNIYDDAGVSNLLEDKIKSPKNFSSILDTDFTSGVSPVEGSLFKTNTIGVASAVTLDAFAGYPNVVLLNTGTDATGSASIISNGFLMLAANESKIHIIEFDLTTNLISDQVTHDFVVMAGLSDTSFEAVPTTGLYIKYEFATLMFVITAGGVETAQYLYNLDDNSAVNFINTQRLRFKIQIINASKAYLTINDRPIASPLDFTALGLSLVGIKLLFGVGQVKQLGNTPSLLYCDWFKAYTHNNVSR